jgi:lysophospholipase L1-like esterase
MESSDWQIEVAGVSKLRDGLYGLGGARFVGEKDAEAIWRLRGQRSVELAYWAAPDGGTFEFEADGAVIGTGDTQASEIRPGYVTFILPEGSSEFKLHVSSGTVQLFGVEFRTDRRGIIYSSLGVNGASVTLLSRSFNRAHLAAQLSHYDPDLVVLAYGTNESGFPDFIDSNWDTELTSAVKRIRAALPTASILLMSPMDRGVVLDDGSIGTIATLPRIVQIEARVAAEQGVAFFNTFEAMGGEGTMGRWYSAEPRLVGADFIHPMPGGAKVIGELLYSALRDGYKEYRQRREALSQAGNSKAKTGQ